jgi:hypothetical protein
MGDADKAANQVEANRVDANGRTQLIEAAVVDDYVRAEFLLQKGANTEIPDRVGRARANGALRRLRLRPCD